MSTAVLRVRDLVVEHRVKRGQVVHAVSGVSFDLAPGQTLGLVGESGCGKSSLARALIQLPAQTAGDITLDGTSLSGLDRAALRTMRHRIQMIFQDPIASLNPRHTVSAIIETPLRLAGGTTRARRRQRVDELLDAVGLPPEQARGRRPHEFSGGQCQRISIARAIALSPDVLICDEPVSALDVSVQAQILNLLLEMQKRLELAMLFISHDLAVVRHVADHVAVMYLGRLCEMATVERLYEAPAHPYTRMLLDSVPQPDPTVRPVPAPRRNSELPSPLNPPAGCRFHTRCPRADAVCREQTPAWRELEAGHRVACHFPLTRQADQSF